MKLSGLMKALLISLSTIAIAVSCDKEPVGGTDTEPNTNEPVYFLKVSNVTDVTAEVTVIPYLMTEEDTWYGFYTDEIKPSEEGLRKQILSEITDLAKHGRLESSVRSDAAVNEVIEGLKEKTKYRYIVFGLSKDGELNEERIKAFDFTTEETRYQKIQDRWEASFTGYQIDEETGYDCFNIHVQENIPGSKYFYPVLINKNNYDMFLEDGNTEEQIAASFGNQMEMMFTYMIKEEGKTMDEMAMTGTDTFLQPRYTEMGAYYSGDYYIHIYGFNADGTADKRYSVSEVKIEEDKNVHPGFEKWLGEWELSDGRNRYVIEIRPFDNNFAYELSGWETGKQAETDLNKQPFVKPGRKIKIEARYLEEDEQFIIETQPIGLINNTDFLGLAGFFANGGKLECNIYDVLSMNLATSKIASATLGKDGTAQLKGITTELEAKDPFGNTTDPVKITYKWFRFAKVNTGNLKWSVFNEKAPILPITMTRLGDLAPEEPEIGGGMQKSSPAAALEHTFIAPAFAGKEEMKTLRRLVMKNNGKIIFR